MRRSFANFDEEATGVLEVSGRLGYNGRVVAIGWGGAGIVIEIVSFFIITVAGLRAIGPIPLWGPPPAIPT